MAKKTTIALVVLVIIVGSAALIWIFNFVQGHDLSEPPAFDLSVYQNLDWDSPQEVYQNYYVKEETTPESQEEQEGSEEQVQAEYLPKSIYFNDYFLSSTASNTQALIHNFLQDFGDLKNYAVVDLMAQKCYTISIPVESRQEVLEQLLPSSVASVQVSLSGLPNYDLCFGEPVYANEVTDYLQNYPQVIFEEPQQERPDYIAYVQYDDYEKVKNDLQILQQNFADVIKIVE